MISVPYSDLSIIDWWCRRNISPRKYYFHNRFGGEGWEVKRTQGIWMLTTEDSKFETYLKLKYL
jgi:hypothetical protein